MRTIAVAGNGVTAARSRLGGAASIGIIGALIGWKSGKMPIELGI